MTKKQHALAIVSLTCEAIDHVTAARLTERRGGSFATAGDLHEAYQTMLRTMAVTHRHGQRCSNEACHACAIGDSELTVALEFISEGLEQLALHARRETAVECSAHMRESLLEIVQGIRHRAELGGTH